MADPPLPPTYPPTQERSSIRVNDSRHFESLPFSLGGSPPWLGGKLLPDLPNSETLAVTPFGQV